MSNEAGEGGGNGDEPCSRKMIPSAWGRPCLCPSRYMNDVNERNTVRDRQETDR